MVYQLFGLAASLMVPFIPKIINAVVGSDSEATARAKLQPHYMDMVARFIGQGMNREQASRAAEEGIQGALHEAMNKEVLPPWVDDVATIAGIASGLGVTGGMKLLSSGAKLASAKMAQGGAKLAGKAAEMEKTADRINGVVARGKDPARLDKLGKQIAKPAPAVAPVAKAPVSNALSQEEEDMAGMINRTEAPKPAAASKPLGQDDIDELIKQATSPVPAAQAKDTLMRPLGLPAPRATSLEQELAAGRASRNDDAIMAGLDQPRIASRTPRRFEGARDAEFEEVQNGKLQRPFSSPIEGQMDIPDMPRDARLMHMEDIVRHNRRMPKPMVTVRPQQKLGLDEDKYIEELMKANPE